jgi:hypothetical protein
MVFEPSVAVFDACILYPFHLRNIIVQAAVDRLVEARWTDAIHDEWIRSLTTGPPTVPIERLQRTRRLMDEALPTAMVSGYEDHVAAVNLPDPSDRHVVGAGIAPVLQLSHMERSPFPGEGTEEVQLAKRDPGRLPLRPLRRSPRLDHRLSR